MATFIELPNDERQVQEHFQQLLDTPDETIVLVLGSDDVAEQARERVQQIVEANRNNSDIFEFVNFVAVSDPNFILPQLRNLENKTGEVLDNLNDYAILSISPFKNVLAEAVTKDRFLRGKGSISTAILKALALG